jgi:ABC-type uncharacterized transport system involved in gliding motility auxiliary subunit
MSTTTSWLQTRQTKYGAYAVIYSAIIIAVLILANFLANRYSKSYDSTSNKRFSLSEQTEKLVKNLNQDVTATYVDKSSGFRTAKDTLDRYQALSPKLHVKYLDYTREPAAARAVGARTAGTVVFEGANKRDEAKSVTEEELTGALIRVLKTGERNICFTSGLGEHPVDDQGQSSYSGIKEVAEKSNYKVRTIPLLEKPEVPKDCTVLVVGGPKRDYPEALATAVKNYVEGGGRALIMLDPPLKGMREDVSENPELIKVLKGWGVTPTDEIVLDVSGAGRFFRMGPEIPLVTAYESQAIVRDLKDTATAMPLARPLEVKTSEGKATVEKMFSSSGNSFAKSVNALKGEVAIDTGKDKKGPFVLAAAGKYNNGQPNNEGRFVVIGTSSFGINGYLSFGGNRDLAGNTLNWLAADEELISIRPKDPEDRRIQVTNRQMGVLSYTTLLLLPLLIALVGFSVWWQRR